MKLKDIEFCNRPGYEMTTLWLLLPGGYWVEKENFELAWSLINIGLPLADLTKPKTAKEICNAPNWSKRRCGVRIKLGRCIKYFVVNDRLPLRITNEGKGGSRKYTRK